MQRMVFIPSRMAAIDGKAFVSSGFVPRMCLMYDASIRATKQYPQPVFAQGPFLQHESLPLLVPHSVPALRLHGVKVEAEGLAGKEAACERMHGGRLHYTLPLLDMGIGAAFK